MIQFYIEKIKQKYRHGFDQINNYENCIENMKKTYCHKLDQINKDEKCIFPQTEIKCNNVYAYTNPS